MRALNNQSTIPSHTHVIAGLGLLWRAIGLVEPSAAHADPNTASYELQERCAKHAREWFLSQYGKDRTILGNSVVISTKSTTMTVEFVNHYNSKHNTCIVLETVNYTELDSGTLVEKIYNLLNNVNFEEVIVSFRDPDSKGKMHMCTVSGTHCHSLEEWGRLVRPFMEE